MSILTLLVGLIMKLVGAFKRMLCFLHIRRHRKTSGSILPLHTDSKTVAVGEIQMSLPTNDIELESWDSWGTGDREDFSHAKSHQQPNNSTHQLESRFPNKKQQTDQEPEPEIDYFQELHLEPSISRTQKILVRKKDNQLHNHYVGGMSTRLAMSSEIPIVSGELGVLEDQESGWSAEAIEDLTSEANSAIRDKRRIERERKLAEHQQKKLQKETARAGKKDRFMAASKMS